jgi:hypothetical protein
MPNKNTFEIKPIREWIYHHLILQRNLDTGISRVSPRMEIVDPFCGQSEIGTVRNDMRQSGIDSAIWLESIPDLFADVVLFDPPYSPRQKKECYDDVGVHLSDTTSGYWALLKDHITRITRHGGVVLSFGWNSNGIGMSRGFEIINDPINLIVPHGGNHNDTICTAERKI